MARKDPLDPVFEDIGRTLEDTAGNLGIVAREYRIELAWIAASSLAFGGAFLAMHKNATAAGVVVGAIWLLLLAYGPTRRAIRQNLTSSNIRRRWDRAVQHCGFRHPIRISRVDRVSSGHRALIRVGRGISIHDVEMRREQLAASMAIRELQVKRDPHNAASGTVTFVKTDPLADVADTVWPGAPGAARRRTSRVHWPKDPPPPRFVKPKKPRPGSGGGGTSIWDPIPVGVDEHGSEVAVRLIERNVLVGGVPGSGKSIAMSMCLATAAIDAETKIYLIDGKMVEFAMWEDCAQEYAHSIDEAIALLGCLERAMTDNLRALRKKGLRKLERGGDVQTYVLFVDELMLFTSNVDTKKAKEFTTLLTDLVARGRAAGIMVCAATQKPEGSVVSTNLRDLFAYRLALRCSTPDASDTILGRGWASQGYNAMNIAPSEPGVGYLLAEDGLPRRIRTYYLDDDDVRALAARAKEERQHL